MAIRPLPKTVGLVSTLAALGALLASDDFQSAVGAALGLIGHASAAPEVSKALVGLAAILAFFARSAVDPHRQCATCASVDALAAARKRQAKQARR